MLRKGLSGIVGLVRWFSPFQINLANRIVANQIATWSHVHQKTCANLVGKSLTCKRFCLCSTFQIKFCTGEDIQRMPHSISAEHSSIADDHFQLCTTLLLQTRPLHISNVILVDMWPCGDPIGQNYLEWQEPRNQPKDTRPPLPWPFC